MTKQHPTLGPGVEIDVNRLLVSRLLIQANSGAGKSWTIRRLLEQTYGACQHIVIDVEGEFHSLRQKFDYVLAGKGGDCPADVKSAPLLARRLLELNVSAVIDIYELGLQRTRFVQLFLEALVNSPRELWHPALIVVDEAHLFCPEKGRGEAASTAAVIDLMTRGRKRGFCGVLATQRISKLNKDAAAECNNKLIGRSSLDVDMKRAAEELGFTSREEMQQLRKLPAGTFFAFGPAIATEVVELKIGPVQTTHPEAGEQAPPPTPPRERIRKVLGELADLPKEAEGELRTTAELRARVKQLEAEARAAAKAAPAQVQAKVVEKAVIKDGQLKRIESIAEHLGALIHRSNAVVESAHKSFADVSDRAATLNLKLEAELATVRAIAAPPTNREIAAKHFASDGKVSKQVGKHVIRTGVHRADEPRHTDRVSLPVGEAATLRALIQYPGGLRREQLTVLTRYKRSTRDAYIARLRERGLVDVQSDRVVATQAGVDAMPNAEPLPTGAALREMLDRELPAGERQVLGVLCDRYPEAVAREDLDEPTGFKRSTRDAYLSRLAAKELVLEAGRGMVKASDTLFEVAS